MRNNPKYKAKENFQTVGYERFQKFVEKKKKRRFFRVHRAMLKKLLVHKNKSKEISAENATKFVEVVDDLLKLKGAMKKIWVSS